jgi:GTP-binding protein HflX
MLISDTVGFLKDLPHNLIASFHATLAEVLEADILIHIVDATAEDLEAKIVTVEDVLTEIHADAKNSILVFNKIDRLFDEEKERCKRKFPRALFVSATKGFGLDALRKTLHEYFFTD